MELIDTHCHIFAKQYAADRGAMMKRAGEAGVSHFLLPNIDAQSLPELYATASEYPKSCHFMLGLHPTSVAEDYHDQLAVIFKEIEKNKPIAIGEIGLDYYWDVTYKNHQRAAFLEQLIWAKELDLPVSMHTRNSFEDALELVKQVGGLRGVFHCFSGNADDAQRAVDSGFYLGIGGVVTFKNGGLDTALADIPLDALVLETDSPYLAPIPYRGKRNEPAYLTYIAGRLADIKNTRVDEVARITTENAKRIFSI